NDSMERVSGWYKRNTQLILTIIAVLVTATLNADTLVVARRLYEDSSLRASVNAAAENVKPPDSPSAGSPSTDVSVAAETAKARADAIRSQLVQDLRMPLCWSEEDLGRLGIGRAERLRLRSSVVGQSPYVSARHFWEVA